MKLKSHAKLKDVLLKVKVNEKIAGLLEQYVVYANTQLGHTFADVKELSAEVLRAFVDEDRGFKAWRERGTTEEVASARPPENGAAQHDATPMFENGLRAKKADVGQEG